MRNYKVNDTSVKNTDTTIRHNVSWKEELCTCRWDCRSTFSIFSSKYKRWDSSWLLSRYVY